MTRCICTDDVINDGHSLVETWSHDLILVYDWLWICTDDVITDYSCVIVLFIELPGMPGQMKNLII